MPGWAITDNNSHPNELQADEALIAGEGKTKQNKTTMSKPTESLQSSFWGKGLAWLGMSESNRRFLRWF